MFTKEAKAKVASPTSERLCPSKEQFLRTKNGLKKEKLSEINKPTKKAFLTNS